MSSKHKDFDPLSALFRDLSDSEEDVPEPLRVTSSDTNPDETTTVIMPVNAGSEIEEDSDEDLVEPLILKQSAPDFQKPFDPDETEQVPVTKQFPPKPAHTLVSPSQKSDIARTLIEAALQNQTVPKEVELPTQKPIEEMEPVVAKKNKKTKQSKSKKSSKDDRWSKIKRPKSALEMALEIAAEEMENEQENTQGSGEASAEETLPPIEKSWPPIKDSVPEVELPKKDNESPLNTEKKNASTENNEEQSEANVLLTEHIASLLQPVFPNLAHFSVVRAMYADDRPLFESLWKAHRNKFILEGRLEYAISTLSVIHALKNAPKNDLVAAHMETDASDYLVWIRPSNGDVLAAFQDARRFFA